METHSALLEQWYFLLVSMDSISFQFFVHPKVSGKLSAIPAQYLTIGNSISDFSFDKYDAVVINTLHRNFGQYKTLFKSKPVLCLVHNLNFSLFFKGISISDFLSERDRFAYYLKLYLKEKVGSERRQLLNAKRFGVLSPTLYNEIEKKSAFANKTQVVQLNYCDKFEFVAADTIEIVMPGNVSNKRKDLDLVFSVLKKLKPKSRLHFTFLGRPENDKVRRSLKLLEECCHEKISITYFERFIPWEEYSSLISKAQLLLCPVRTKTSFYWVDEFYGQTKVSGSEADCIFNGKIGIFPSSYPKMDWHNLYYEKDSDLLELLNNLTLEKLQCEYELLQPYTERYEFENVKAALEKQLLNLTL